jgi:hypothetical protein
MTLAVQTVRQVFNGNGSTVDFTIPFAFSANDEVEVIHVSSAGVETAQTYTTHYTIVGSTLTMVTAPASGAFLLIKMDKDLEQQTCDFADNTPFLPTTVESSDDYQASLIQQLNERIDRCVTFPKSSTHTNIEIPRTLVASSVPMVNAGATAFEWITRDSLAGDDGTDGADGDDGARGSLWTTGSGAPAGSANAGDLYLDEDTGNVWQYS